MGVGNTEARAGEARQAGYVHGPIERRARTVPIGYHNVVQPQGKWEGVESAERAGSPCRNEHKAHLLKGIGRLEGQKGGYDLVQWLPAG